MVPVDDTPDPPAPDDAAPSAPLPTRRGGRPGVSTDEVAEALDTWIARTGRAPSLRELRQALGDRGSLTTLTALRTQLLGDRLLAGDAPLPKSVEATMARAVNAALKVLAGDAAEAAEERITAAEVSADTRVQAAEALTVRAQATAQTTALEREHALGRLEEIEATLARECQQSAEREQSLAAATVRERELRELVANQGTQLTERARTLQEAEGTVRALQEQLDERDAQLTTVTREHERDHQTALVEQARHEAGQAAAEQRAAEQAAALAQANARMATLDEERTTALTAAAGLAATLEALDDRLQRTERLETERDTARERAERLDATLAVLKIELHGGQRAQEADRQTLHALHAYLGRLHGALRSAGVADDQIEPVPTARRAEQQQDLGIGE